MAQNLNFFTDRPVFAGFLFDASGSMSGYQTDVIAGHREMLRILRDSEKCMRGVLYVYQSLFADTVTLLQPFYPLDPQGSDNVVALTTANYRPDGYTALYDAIVSVVNELEKQIEYARQQGFRGSARIAVITDGEENHSRASSADVKAAVSRLRSREWLESSVVVGLRNQDFSDDMLESLRESIGFAQAIGLDKSPREIRRAFVLASKPKVDR